MLKMNGVLKLRNQSTWQEIANAVFIIASLADLKDFLKKEFPEFKNFNFNIDVDKDPEEFNDLWSYTNEVFLNLKTKFGLKGWYTIKRLFQGEYVDKNNNFLFELFLIFKFKNKEEQIVYYSDIFNTYQSRQNKIEYSEIIKDKILTFKENVKERINTDFDGAILVEEDGI